MAKSLLSKLNIIEAPLKHSTDPLIQRLKNVNSDPLIDPWGKSTHLLALIIYYYKKMRYSHHFLIHYIIIHICTTDNQHPHMRALISYDVKNRMLRNDVLQKN